MNTHILLNKLLAHIYTLYPYASTYFIRWLKMNFIVGTFVTLGFAIRKAQRQ